MPTAIRTLIDGLDHPEGIAWDPNGFLFAGGEAGQIYRVDIRGKRPESQEIANTGGFALGIALDDLRRVYVCDMGLRKVVRVDPSSGAIEHYADGDDDEPMMAPNHLVFDRTGRLYVSDSGEWGAENGKIWVVESDRTCRVVDRESSRFPNGLAIDPDGEFLYVVESTLPGVVRHKLFSESGELGPREVHLELPQTVPDGLAFAADGRLVITCYRPDRVYLWSRDSMEILVDDWQAIGVSAPTNAAFFGPNLDRLGIANLGDLFLSEILTDIEGADLNRPKGLI
ncbi:SMP-30/gluconolactonase/LRE family protein [Aeromicrobium sp.]|uniref:SMP-30/gluconolactonase/LRE family protein n=1 Tax=Aeromicrobium sp. TaxID=1871063 RepID=UPI002FCAD855